MAIATTGLLLIMALGGVGYLAYQIGIRVKVEPVDD